MGSKQQSTPQVAAPKPINPTEQANANVAAQMAAIPKAAQLQFDVAQNPNYGLLAQTNLAENVRQQAFPEEQRIREQTLANVFQQLLSPTGVTEQQQGAQDAIRGRQSDALSRNIQTSANVGGTLYGGRSRQREDRAQTELQQGFASEDIDRDTQSRLNALNAALPILQLLFPQSQLVSPQYINPVASANTQYGGAVTQGGQGMQAQMSNQNAALQQQQMQSQQQSALFNALGSAAGMALAPMTGGASLLGSLGSIGGGNQPGTGFLGGQLGGRTQSEILGIPTAQYR